MGVYIPNIKMPQTCENCFFLGTDSNAHWYCFCQKKKISITSEKAYDGGCPLIDYDYDGTEAYIRNLQDTIAELVEELEEAEGKT